MTILPCIQARMESTRFPGKVLVPLIHTISMLSIVICRAFKVLACYAPVLLTTESEQDRALILLAKQMGVAVVLADTPLERYEKAWERWKPDYILRICGDAPLFDNDLTDKLVYEVYAHPTFNYYSYIHSSGKPIALTSYGIFPEIFKFGGNYPPENIMPEIEEHVTPMFYTSKEHCYYLPVPQILEQYPFKGTVDTSEDADRISRILAHNPRNYCDIVKIIKDVPYLAGDCFGVGNSYEWAKEKKE